MSAADLEHSRAGGSVDPFAPSGEQRSDAHAGAPWIAARYLVTGIAGQGGQAEVLLARDTRLERDVAIKRLTGDVSPARLLAEARVAATLEHPGIVPVYDAGQDEAGTYCVMRVVRGRSLADTLRALSSLPARDARAARLALVRPLLAAAEALAYANQRGVLHGDVKPGNLMIGELGEVQVVDWGLARALGSGAPRFGGTPRYASPEQTRNEPLDAKADVWGLGATLFEVLAGEPPFASLSADDAARALAAGDAPDLSRLSAAPIELAAIVARALAPSAERYPDARALARDLASWLDGRRVEAHAYSPLDHLRRLWRTRRLPFVLGATAALVVAALSITYVTSLVAEGERTRAALVEARTAQALSLAADNAGPEAVAIAAQAIVDSADAVPAALGIAAAFAHTPRAERLASWPVPGCQQVRPLRSSRAFLCIGPSWVSLHAVDGSALVQRWELHEVVRDALLVEPAGPLFVRYDDQRVVAVDPATALPRPGHPVRWGNLAASPRGHVGLAWWTQHVHWIDGRTGAPGDMTICEAHQPLGAATIDLSETRLAAICEDGRLTVLDLERGGDHEVLTPFGRAEAQPSALAFTTDGAELVVGTRRGRLARLDLATGEIVGRLDNGPLGLERLDVPPVPEEDGLVAALTADRIVRLWKTRTGEWLEPTRRGPVEGHAFGFGDPTLLTWDAAELTAWRLGEGMAWVQTEHGVSTLAVSPDGRLVAIGDGVLGVTVRELATGRVRVADRLVGRMPKHLAFSPDGRWLASVSVDRPGVSFIDVDRGAPLLDVPFDQFCRRVDWLDDDRVIAAGANDALLLVDRRAPDGAPRVIAWAGPMIVDSVLPHALLDASGAVHRLDATSATFASIGALPFATQIARGDDGTIFLARGDTLFTLAPGSEPRPFHRVDARISALAAHGSLVAIGDMRGGVTLVALPSSRRVWTFLGHTERVSGLAFTRDGDLVTGGWDGRVRRMRVDPHGH
ncbi:MAG: protein kinase [Deltaproteobacteria bacterium]|nr:protein kinase [Deltaproteobacteria bacterium]